MAVESADEATPALMTAGLVLTVVGVLLATFPAGLVLGVTVALAGAVLFIVFAIRAWRDWRTRPKRRASEHPDPDRFWNAEERLKSLMVASGGIVVGAIALAILNPAHDRWGMVWGAGPILVAAAISFLLVRRHNRRKKAAPKDAGSS